MSLAALEPAAWLKALQKGVRAAAGKKLTPALKRWRHTRSGNETPPVLDAAAARFLIRHGILDAGDAPQERERVYDDFLTRLARATGEAPGVIEAWLHAFAAGEYGVLAEGICAAEPHCARCPLSGECRFLSAGARDERVSGRVLERTLASPAKPPVAPGTAELAAFLMADGKGGARAVARAEALLKALGGVRGLLAASGERLRELGLKADAVARLHAVAELFQLWSREVAPQGKVFRRGRDFYEHYYLRLRDLKKEQFFVAGLDQKNRLLGEELVSSGSLTETLVHPREVLAPAIRWRAAAVCVVHNHPSGDPAPSRPDRKMTRRLRRAAELLGLRFLDHVIVGDGAFFSFTEEESL